MEEERRRRRNGDEAEESTAKGTKRPRGERTVNDEEVDEFFAIMKRLQEVKKMKSSLASRDETRRCRVTWQPVFTLDDFKVATDGRDREDRRTKKLDDCHESEVVSKSFDLNAEPEMESTSC